MKIITFFVFCWKLSPFLAVVVPDQAFVLDWVFADGPPNNATVYDNNKRQDFHAIVPKPISEELNWFEEEHRIFKKLQEERRLREEEKRAKVMHDFISNCMGLCIFLNSTKFPFPLPFSIVAG